MNHHSATVTGHYKYDNGSHDIVDKIPQDLAVQGKKGVDYIINSIVPGVNGHSIPMQLNRPPAPKKPVVNQPQKVNYYNRSPFKQVAKRHPGQS